MFQNPNDHRNIMMKYDGEILKIPFIGNEMVKYDLTFNPRTLTIIRLVVEYLVRPTFPQERKVYRISSWISVTGDVFADSTIG